MSGGKPLIPSPLPSPRGQGNIGQSPLQDVSLLPSSTLNSLLQSDSFQQFPSGDLPNSNGSALNGVISGSNAGHSPGGSSSLPWAETDVTTPRSSQALSGISPSDSLEYSPNLKKPFSTDISPIGKPNSFSISARISDGGGADKELFAPIVSGPSSSGSVSSGGLRRGENGKAYALNDSNSGGSFYDAQQFRSGGLAARRGLVSSYGNTEFLPNYEYYDAHAKKMKVKDDMPRLVLPTWQGRVLCKSGKDGRESPDSYHSSKNSSRSNSPSV